MQMTQGMTRAPSLDQPIPEIVRPGRIGRTFFAAVWRAVLGPGGSTPSGYRREGFPEHELYQIMSGRRDRFDSR